MSINPDEVKEGDVLVGHGLLSTPALLIENKIELDEGRFLDFCTLINALTIHDRLITLRATVPDYIKNSRLYQYLRKKNILYELNIRYNQFSQEELLEIEDLFGSKITEEEINTVLNSIYSEYSQDFGLFDSSLNDRDILLRRSKFIDEVIRRKPDGWSSKDFISLTEDIVDTSIPFNQSSNTKHDHLQLHFLRTAGYWEIAGKYNLAFLPDFMRIPIISLYNSRLRQSLRMFLASRVDELTRKELTAALQIATPTILPVPNSVSIFLNRYSKNNMEDTLDNMRDEFTEHRKTIVKWEKRLHNEKLNNYNDVTKVIREVNASLEALKHKDWTEIAVSAAYNVASDTVSSSLTSSISTGGFASYIEEGVNFIKRWRQVKRISYFNSGRKEAMNTKGMHNLEKFFGRPLTIRQIDRFLGLTNSIDRLIRFDSG